MPLSLWRKRLEWPQRQGCKVAKYAGIGGFDVTRTAGFLAMIIMAGLCVTPLTNTRAHDVLGLAADLKGAAGAWAFDAPTGAAILIDNTNGRYTLRPDDRAAPADRRWAAQVRQSLILAQYSGAAFQRPIITQASLGTWTIRLEGGLSIVASSAPEALAFFLSVLTDRTPTGDLDLITDALIDEATSVRRVATGTTEVIALPPGIASAVSADPRLKVSAAQNAGHVQVEATLGVPSGYYQIFFYDGTSQFSPSASTLIKVAAAKTAY